MNNIGAVFPETLTFGWVVRFGYSTNVVSVDSGGEQANALWDQPLLQFQWSREHLSMAAVGITPADIGELIAFLRNVRGRAYPFLLTDWTDRSTRRDGQAGAGYAVSAADQGLGTGDGAVQAFQLVKRYPIGSVTPVPVRPLTRPRPGTVRIAVDGTEQTEGVDFTVDVDTGILTLASPPAPGLAVTGGCEFYVPVRLDTDEPSIEIMLYDDATNTMTAVEKREC
jgi:uncharacterized protein (TIGR02217 family)